MARLQAASKAAQAEIDRAREKEAEARFAAAEANTRTIQLQASTSELQTLKAQLARATADAEARGSRCVTSYVAFASYSVVTTQFLQYTFRHSPHLLSFLSLPLLASLPLFLYNFS